MLNVEKPDEYLKKKNEDKKNKLEIEGEIDFSSFNFNCRGRSSKIG